MIGGGDVHIGRSTGERIGSITEAGRGGTAFDPRVVRRLLAYLRPHRRRMGLAVLCMLISTALTVAAPVLLKQAIDGPIAAKDMGGLFVIVALLAGAFLGTFGADTGQRYLLSWIGQRILATLRMQLFRHLQELSMSYHDRAIVGITISRVINDVAIINDLLSQGLISLVGDLLVLTAIIVTMIKIHSQLALLTFAVLPLMLLATWWFSTVAGSAFRDTRARVAALVGHIAETIGGMRVIQTYGRERAMEAQFTGLNDQNRQSYIKAMSLSYVFMPIVEILSVVAMAVVLWFGGRAIVAGTVTLGIVVAFLAYVNRFFEPIQELSQLYTTMQAAMAGGENVLRLLDTPVTVNDPEDGRELPLIEGRVNLEHVDFSYVDGVPILKDVTIDVAAGQTVALVGPTGAGKTTIASLIARFYDVNGGAVTIDGTDVRNVTKESLRRQMAIVSQDPFLFADSIADNIRFGQPDATLEEVQEAARLADCHTFITGLPKGYDTLVQEFGSNISVGQRQLISIARALLVNPRILILDEATSSVDTVTELVIQRALKRMLKGRTAIVIAHRLSTVRSADLICVVDDGRIFERGTHTELLSQKGRYADLYERQFVRVAPGSG